MSCTSTYIGGPLGDDDGGCVIRAINAFVSFPFILKCNSQKEFTYCAWVQIINPLIKKYYNEIQTVFTNSDIDYNDIFNKPILDIINKPDNEMAYLNTIDFQIKTERKIECNTEFAMIPQNGAYITESILFAMMLSQLLNPCKKNDSDCEIIPIKITTFKDYIDHIDTYDTSYGCVTLSPSKLISGTHSVCVKTFIKNTEYIHYVIDSLEDKDKSIVKFNDKNNDKEIKHKTVYDDLLLNI